MMSTYGKMMSPDAKPILGALCKKLIIKSLTSFCPTLLSLHVLIPLFPMISRAFALKKISSQVHISEQ